MRKDKLSLCLMLITLALILQTSPVFAGDDKRDHPSISGLETGIYLIFRSKITSIQLGIHCILCRVIMYLPSERKQR